MTVKAAIQTATPGALVELYDLDVTAIGGAQVYRFAADVNALGADIVWGGQTYTRFPLEASGFERGGQGKLPRPSLRVANVTGLIGALALELGDLVGAKVTRTRTFVQYLDVVNFAAGNPTADPNQWLDREIWFIDRKAAENKIFVEWELAAAFDVAGVLLPRRQVIQNICTWRYRGAECGYAGGAVATANDAATSDPALDVCGKRLASCRLRFGAHAELPYGGFPAAGLLR